MSFKIMQPLLFEIKFEEFQNERNYKNTFEITFP